MREDEQNSFPANGSTEKRFKESGSGENTKSQQRQFKSRSESGTKSQQRQYRSQIPQFTSQVPRKQDEDDSEDESPHANR